MDTRLYILAGTFLLLVLSIIYLVVASIRAARIKRAMAPTAFIIDTPALPSAEIVVELNPDARDTRFAPPSSDVYTAMQEPLRAGSWRPDRFDIPADETPPPPPPVAEIPVVSEDDDRAAELAHAYVTELMDQLGDNQGASVESAPEAAVAPAEPPAAPAEIPAVQPAVPVEPAGGGDYWSRLIEEQERLVHPSVSGDSAHEPIAAEPTAIEEIPSPEPEPSDIPDPAPLDMPEEIVAENRVAPEHELTMESVVAMATSSVESPSVESVEPSLIDLVADATHEPEPTPAVEPTPVLEPTPPPPPVSEPTPPPITESRPAPDVNVPVPMSAPTDTLTAPPTVQVPAASEASAPSAQTATVLPDRPSAVVAREADVARPKATISEPAHATTAAPPAADVVASPAPRIRTAAEAKAREAVADRELVAPVEMWFGDFRIGVKAGTRTYEQFCRYADVILRDLEASERARGIR